MVSVRLACVCSAGLSQRCVLETADLNMKSAVKQAADQAEKNTGSLPLKQ